MAEYEIIYDYCDDEGNEERNCIETVWLEGWNHLQDYLKVMRAHGCYHNIYASCIRDEDGEAW